MTLSNNTQEKLNELDKKIEKEQSSIKKTKLINKIIAGTAIIGAIVGAIATAGVSQFIIPFFAIGSLIISSRVCNELKDKSKKSIKELKSEKTNLIVKENQEKFVPYYKKDLINAKQTEFINEPVYTSTPVVEDEMTACM